MEKQKLKLHKNVVLHTGGLESGCGVHEIGPQSLPVETLQKLIYKLRQKQRHVDVNLLYIKNDRWLGWHVILGTVDPITLILTTNERGPKITGDILLPHDIDIRDYRFTPFYEHCRYCYKLKSYVVNEKIVRWVMMSPFQELPKNFTQDKPD